MYKIFISLSLFALLFCQPAQAQKTLPAGINTIRSIAFDYQHRMWVGTFGNGLWLSDSAGIRRFYDSAADKPFSMINNLMVQGGHLYIATAGGGCQRLNLQNLKFDDLRQAPGFEKLHALAHTSTGKTLIGSVGSGTAALEKDTWTTLSESQNLQISWVNNIAEWRGELWLGTASGLYRNRLDKPWKPVFAEISRAINCLIVVNDILYAGTTDRGVYAVQPDKYPQQLSGTVGPINFLVPFSDRLIAGGQLGLWSIKIVQADEISCEIADAKSAALSPKKILYVGTSDGKLYESDDSLAFRHIMSFTENGLEEHKR